MKQHVNRALKVARTATSWAEYLYWLDQVLAGLV